MSIIDKKQKPLATGTLEQEVAEINLLLTEVTTRLEGLGLRLVCSLKEEQTQSDNNAPLLKESSVEWLVKELNQKIDFIPMSKWDEIKEVIEQAREMHKDEIMDAYMANRFDYMLVKDFKHYYNERFGGSK
jgi:SMC interacting uncharacterized protein involved in chromosome segregation